MSFLNADATPTVSVIVLAYNHAEFIGECLASVLAQDLDRPWELLVADDASPDGSAASAAALLAGHDHARVLDTPHNLGMQRNLRRAIEAATGTYVAFVEGDDYWTDPSKLRLQVAIMDEHPEIVAVGHLTTVDNGDGARSGFEHGFGDADRIDLADALGGAMPHFSSLLYRRSALPTTPAWFDELSAADWAMMALLAAQGDVRIIDRDMSTYRKNPHSTWTPRPHLERKMLHLQGLQAFGRHVPDLGAPYAASLASAHTTVAAVALHDRKWGLAVRHAAAAVHADPKQSLGRVTGSLRRRLRRG